MNASRRIAVLDGGRRLDVAVPLGGTVGDVLAGLGLDGPGTRVPVLDGIRADPATPVADVEDGALLVLVDPSEVAPRTRAARVDGAPTGVAPLWWAQVAAGLVLLVVSALQHEARPLVAGVLGACALAATLAAALGHPLDDAARAARMAGPGALVLAAAAFGVPRTQAGTVQLAMLVVFLAVAVLLVVAVATDAGSRTRDAWGTAAVVALVVGVVWAIVLALGWDVSLAAAVTAGAVPLGVRALPSGVLSVPDGYFLDYDRHMDTRWTVRGTVEPVIPTADGAAVRRTVRSAAAAQSTGTVLLCALGALALPVAVAPGGASGLVLGGRIGLLACYALSLTLMARTVGVRALAWTMRASALVAVGLGVRMALTGGSAPVVVAAAGVALIGGVVVASVAVAVGRGARSLVLSRVADVVEMLALVLCLPAGLLAGGIIETLRAFVAA
jgi:hypothetical protein